MAEDLTVFKSDKGRAAYMAAYDRALEVWPVPHESRYVSTSYGKTHVIIAGPEDCEPLVLMHGKGISSTMWGTNMPALSKTRRVYAVDTIGDVGKSEATKIFSERAGFAEWLTEVLDELGIEKADMIGLSMGGFLTINYALARPDRLKKIVLLAPAASFSSLSKGFLFKGIFASVTGSDFLTKKFARSLVAMASILESEMMDQMFVGIKNEKFIMKYAPQALSDEDLKSLKVPTLLVVGEKESVNKDKPARVIERAEKLVENIQTVIVPNAVHLLTEENPELVNSAVLDFLSGDKQAGQTS